jgi:hypothetical protein
VKSKRDEDVQMSQMTPEVSKLLQKALFLSVEEQERLPIR